MEEYILKEMIIGHEEKEKNQTVLKCLKLYSNKKNHPSRIYFSIFNKDYLGRHLNKIPKFSKHHNKISYWIEIDLKKLRLELLSYAANGDVHAFEEIGHLLYDWALSLVANYLPLDARSSISNRLQQIKREMTLTALEEITIDG